MFINYGSVFNGLRIFLKWWWFFISSEKLIKESWKAFENKNSVPEMIEKYKEIIVEFENIEMEPPMNMVDKLIILMDLYTLNSFWGFLVILYVNN